MASSPGRWIIKFEPRPPPTQDVKVYFTTIQVLPPSVVNNMAFGDNARPLLELNMRIIDRGSIVLAMGGVFAGFDPALGSGPLDCEQPFTKSSTRTRNSPDKTLFLLLNSTQRDSCNSSPSSKHLTT